MADMDKRVSEMNIDRLRGAWDRKVRILHLRLTELYQFNGNMKRANSRVSITYIPNPSSTPSIP